MFGRIIVPVFLFSAVVLAGVWLISAPTPLNLADLPDHDGDPVNGERVFYASGCAACHKAPDAEGDAALVLAGGQMLETPLGAVRVPNISPDATHGIGGWSTLDFANAMKRGISPRNTFYTPAFPWTSYRGMRLTDVVDLKAFIDMLPASTADNRASGLSFPFSWRRPIGLWANFLLPPFPPPSSGASAEVLKGFYLTVALGHCSECHTSRNVVFAPDFDLWLAGAPALEGTGFVPNITPSGEGIGEWTEGDIAYFLESGFTPDFDSVGSSMGAVIDNWSKVPAEDRRAVAAYLKAIPPLPDSPR